MTCHTQGWERDDLLRITAKLGEPTDTHTIYEHVDVLIHPLGVHLNEGIAVEVWVRHYPSCTPTSCRTDQSLYPQHIHTTL